MASSTASQPAKPLGHAQAQVYPSPTISNSPSSSNPSFSSAAARQRGPPNGLTPRASRPQTEQKTHAAHMRESNTPDKHANDRLLFLLATFVGNVAHITVKSGEQFTGLFSAASLPKDSAASYQYVLKMAKRQVPPMQQPNGHTQDLDEYIGYGDEHIMVFDAKDVAHINVPNISTDKPQARITNGTLTGFRTDTDISGNSTGRERELQRWEPSGGTSQDLTFSDTSYRKWDQFAENERLYGLTTDYDETFYTTTIDRSAADYERRAAAAEKLAREIEGTTATNAHIAEERGQVPETADGIDEEERFSGVKRDFPIISSANPNRYTPPAKRAPTGQSTVSGAPVDPAIISAQLSRQDPTGRTSNGVASTATAPVIEGGVVQNENAEPLNHGVTAHLDPKSTAPLSQQRPAESKDLKDEPVPIPIPDVSLGHLAQSKSPGRTNPVLTAAIPNTTVNVGRDVLNEFKTFAEREKRSVAERQKLSAKKERDVKLNDLKRFANDFKLKTPVPIDMIGILAKDKQKQIEIIEKSQRQVDEQQQTAQIVATRKAEQKSMPQTPDLATDGLTTPNSAQLEKQNGKGARPTPSLHGAPTTKGDRASQPASASILSPKAGAGNLGQRLLQQRDRTMQSFSGPSSGPAHPANSRSGSIPNAAGAGAARLNVQAAQFKPNPTATTFSPAGERSNGANSPLRPRNQPPPKNLNRTSFFTGQRPDPSKKLSIKDAFNPLTKMRKEVEAQGRIKDFILNGGIPQAYRTPPTWDTSEEYNEKSYVDMFDKPPVPGQTTSPTNVQMPHQHQLPLHLQGSHPVNPPNHAPHYQAFPQQMHGRAGEHRFDEHRMQFSGSQSSQFPSPRIHPVMLPFNNPMMGQMQPQVGQAVGPFPYGANTQQMNQLRQFPTQFIGTPNMTAPVVLQPGVPFMGVPIHPHTPMFSPTQPHVLPAHVMGQHNSGGHSAYSSPRGAHLMMHQGSQQGHAPPQQVYMNPGQHPGQLYNAQHQPQAPHLRGGIPMTHQQSFGGGTHLPQHYQGGPQRQYSQMGNNYGVQAIPMDHGMSQQHHPPPASIPGGGDRDDGK